MTRPKRQPITYSDSLRHAGRSVTVTLSRVWWDYLYTVALNAKLWPVFEAIRKARWAHSEGDALLVSVTAADAEFADLADAAARAGRERSAGLLRDAVKAAKSEKRRKAKPETETDREAFKRIFEAGEVDQDIAEAARRRGML